MKKIILSFLLFMLTINLYSVEINVRSKEVFEDKGNISNQVFRTINIQLQDSTLHFNQIIARNGNKILCITYKGETPDTNTLMWLTYKENNRYGLIEMGMHRTIPPKQFLGILLTGDPEGMAVFYGAEREVASTMSSSIAYKGRQGNYGVYDRANRYPLYYSFNKMKFKYNDYNRYNGFGYLPKETEIEMANGDILSIDIEENHTTMAIDFDKWFELIHKLQNTEEPN